MRNPRNYYALCFCAFIWVIVLALIAHDSYTKFNKLEGQTEIKFKSLEDVLNGNR